MSLYGGRGPPKSTSLTRCLRTRAFMSPPSPCACAWSARCLARLGGSCGRRSLVRLSGNTLILLDGSRSTLREKSPEKFSCRAWTSWKPMSRWWREVRRYHSSGRAESLLLDMRSSLSHGISRHTGGTLVRWLFSSRSSTSCTLLRRLEGSAWTLLEAASRTCRDVILPTVGGMVARRLCCMSSTVRLDMRSISTGSDTSLLFSSDRCLHRTHASSSQGSAIPGCGKGTWRRLKPERSRSHVSRAYWTLSRNSKTCFAPRMATSMGGRCRGFSSSLKCEMRMCPMAGGSACIRLFSSVSSRRL
mmetsp:Transcript_2194/g.5085  ORF Transcript_2194/g.5085 Transcript_2194/m.5085 type:complete len:303 (-) Transcript_2194:785-1693(-)